MSGRSLADIVISRAERFPGGRAYTFLDCGERDGAALTWTDLDERSRRIAAGLVQSVPRGARVLLLFPPGLDVIPAFFGSLRAGTVAIPSYPPSGQPHDRVAARLRGMVADAGLSRVIAPATIFDKRALVAAIVPELRCVQWVNSDALAAASLRQADRDVAPDDIALLQYTSGSTCDPRGVMVTHGNLLHNLESSAALAAHGADSAAVSWLPINHDMGLIEGVLQPAYSGFPVWLMAPAAFLQRPSRWLQAMSRLRATHSGGPNFAYDLCVRRITDSERSELDLRAWRTAFNGSEPIRRHTLESFTRAFGPCGFRIESFRPAYGLAESTLLVASGRCFEEPVFFDADADALRSGTLQPAPKPDHCVSLVASGRPTQGTTIVIVDPARRTRVPHDRVGEIWIASPSVAAGYWRRSADTASTFGARLADTGEGPFLRTGDFGVLNGGLLYVTGRLKDVLIVRGLKHYPEDIELTIERAHAAIRPGCCAAIALHGEADDDVVILAEMAPRYDSGSSVSMDATEGDAVCATLARAMTEAHGVIPTGIVLVPGGTLPRTTSGKLQRYQCREQFLSGLIPIVHHWTGDRRGDERERVAS